MKTKIKIFSLGITIFYFLLLFSCSDIKTEKDKHTDIPEFPKFKNNTLKLVKVKEIVNKTDSTYSSGSFDTRFLVKDSTLYIISFFASVYNLEVYNTSNKSLEYKIDLVIIKNTKINHIQWTDKDFELNFDIDNNNNLTIGKYQFSAKSNYKKKESINNLKKLNDSTFHKSIYNYVNLNEKAKIFDQVIIGSRLKSGAVAHSPGSIFIWKYQPIYLKYYKIKYKNKFGLTKVYDGLPPIFLKLNDELYYIKDEDKYIDENNRIFKMVIYKIE